MRAQAAEAGAAAEQRAAQLQKKNASLRWRASRGDIGEIQGRYRGDIAEIYGGYRGDMCLAALAGIRTLTQPYPYPCPYSYRHPYP